MSHKSYFRNTVESTLSSEEFFSLTVKTLEELTNAFSQLDTQELSTISSSAKKYSLISQNFGDEILFNFLGCIADYAHVLQAGISDLSEEDEDGYTSSWDPTIIHPILKELFKNAIARIVSEEYKITNEEAKVFISLTGKFEIDLDFYF